LRGGLRQAIPFLLVRSGSAHGSQFYADKTVLRAHIAWKKRIYRKRSRPRVAVYVERSVNLIGSSSGVALGAVTQCLPPRKSHPDGRVIARPFAASHIAIDLGRDQAHPRHDALGLVPFWAKDIRVGFSNINAKAEGDRGQARLLTRTVFGGLSTGIRRAQGSEYRPKPLAIGRSGQRPFQKWVTSDELVAHLQLTSAFPGSLRSSAGSTFRTSASLPMIFKLA
jgi:hypothetical protein